GRLVGIIKPRIEETFELVRAKIEKSGLPKPAARRVVLTGGASQLAGADQIAGSVLDRQIRLGRPRRLRGLAESATGPAFAVAAGLVLYAIERHDSGGLAPLAALAPPNPARLRFKPERRPQSEGPARPGMIRRLGTWFHARFYPQQTPPRGSDRSASRNPESSPKGGTHDAQPHALPPAAGAPPAHHRLRRGRRRLQRGQQHDPPQPRGGR